jgi:hypothetical protein
MTNYRLYGVAGQDICYGMDAPDATYLFAVGVYTGGDCLSLKVSKGYTIN